MTTSDLVAVPATRFKRRRTWIIIGSAVAVVAATAVVIVAAQPRAFTIHGTISIVNIEGSSTPCAIAGYSDVREGSDVTVTDASHKTIAVGALQSGHADSLGLTCVYKFAVADVPGGSDFYGIEVSHRGSVQVKAAQLKRGVDLTLG